MTEIPLTETSYGYRGERFRLHSSGGPVYKRLWVEGELTLQRFPDALEFSNDPEKRWVMLPTNSLDARYSQLVTGKWHGAPVTVGPMVQVGRNRGLVYVNYDGNFPEEAKSAGFSGDQYNGWSKLVQPSEVDDIKVEMFRYSEVG